MASEALQRGFFARPTVHVAQDLLGTVLVREFPDGQRRSGWIVETEAYVGSEDQACHARHGKTARNAPMWGPPGHAYVYFTYGMHWMLNVVTDRDGFPAAVLLRALYPKEGRAAMRRRRGDRSDRELTDGPAKLCQALDIEGEFSGLDLCAAGSPLRFHEGTSIPDERVTRGPRVGLNKVAEPWLSKPWRFQVKWKSMTEILRTEGGI